MCREENGAKEKDEEADISEPKVKKAKKEKKEKKEKKAKKEKKQKKEKSKQKSESPSGSPNSAEDMLEGQKSLEDDLRRKALLSVRKE